MPIDSAGHLNMNFLSTQIFRDSTVQPIEVGKLLHAEWALDDVTNGGIDFKGVDDLNGFDYNLHKPPSSPSLPVSGRVLFPYISVYSFSDIIRIE